MDLAEALARLDAISCCDECVLRTVSPVDAYDANGPVGGCPCIGGADYGMIICLMAVVKAARERVKEPRLRIVPGDPQPLTWGEEEAVCDPDESCSRCGFEKPRRELCRRCDPQVAHVGRCRGCDALAMDEANGGSGGIVSHTCGER